MKPARESGPSLAALAVLLLFPFGSTEAIAQEAPLQSVHVEPGALPGEYQDLTGQRNFVVEPLGDDRFSITCEDWEGFLIWGRNTGGYSGAIRFVDQPTVETNPAFQPGGEAENAVGFLQVVGLEDGSYELRFRWWLNDTETSWSYRMVASG